MKYIYKYDYKDKIKYKYKIGSKPIGCNTLL